MCYFSFFFVLCLLLSVRLHNNNTDYTTDIDGLFALYSKHLPATDPSTQVETALDQCLKHQRMVEMARMVDDIRKLRESACDIDEAIDELDMKLTAIRQLILDVCTERSQLYFRIVLHICRRSEKFQTALVLCPSPSLPPFPYHPILSLFSHTHLPPFSSPLLPLFLHPLLPFPFLWLSHPSPNSYGVWGNAVSSLNGGKAPAEKDLAHI